MPPDVAVHVAPWPEAVRYMRALAGMELDWTVPASGLRLRRADMPELGPGWLPLDDIVTDRPCPGGQVVCD